MKNIKMQDNMNPTTIELLVIDRKGSGTLPY